MRFRPENGMSVVARGSVAIYEREGVYQLYVDSMTPEGAGALAVAFEQLRERLEREGLFDASLKKPLPAFPKIIGVVTSPSGAVIRDIYRVAKQRNPHVRLALFPTQVQGDGSAEGIAEGIDFFNRAYPVDLLIVGRGGGSAEDLWSFNEEIVVRAIHASRIPVISAVGHETDFTLSDFAADCRAATPSHAAEMAVPDAGELKRRLASLVARMQNAANLMIQHKRERLTRCQQSPALRQPRSFLGQLKQRLDMAGIRLFQARERLMREKKHRLELALERLDILNPARALRRGYGIIENERGIVRRIKDAPVGSRISIVLADGKLSATVDREIMKG